MAEAKGGDICSLLSHYDHLSTRWLEQLKSLEDRETSGQRDTQLG